MYQELSSSINVLGGQSLGNLAVSVKCCGH